jgi:hypothetical protein
MQENKYDACIHISFNSLQIRLTVSHDSDSQNVDQAFIAPLLVIVRSYADGAAFKPARWSSLQEMEYLGASHLS